MWIGIIFLFCEIAHLEREPAVSFLAIAMIKFLEEIENSHPAAAPSEEKLSIEAKQYFQDSH